MFTIQGAWHEKILFPPHIYLEVVGSNPVTSKKISSHKFNCLHEGMVPILKMTFLSHFLPIRLARCYLDPSFLLFLLTLESLSKLYIVPTWKTAINKMNRKSVCRQPLRFCDLFLFVLKVSLPNLSLLSPRQHIYGSIIYCFHNTQIEMHLLKGPD